MKLTGRDVVTPDAHGPADLTDAARRPGTPDREQRPVSSRPVERIPELDGLRGVAVVLVLAGHLHLPGFTDGGNVGVTIFFVLSGYLITGVLLTSERIGTFYVRRAARLFPSLALLLAVVTVGALVTGAWAIASTGVVSSALYYSNIVFAGGTTLGPLDHMWSLATEEQFYFVWPWFVLLAPRRWLAPIAIIGILLASGLRLLGPQDDPALWSALHLPVTRMDALLVGCVVRLVPLRRPTFAMTACAAAVIALITVGISYSIVIPFLLLPLELAAAVVLLRRPAILAGRPLQWFGEISYALYLWHFPLLFVLGPIGALLAIPVAWASTRILEQPIRAWARRATSGGPSAPARASDKPQITPA